MLPHLETVPTGEVSKLPESSESRKTDVSGHPVAGTFSPGKRMSFGMLAYETIKK
jgi:hypothetical protein